MDSRKCAIQASLLPWGGTGRGAKCSDHGTGVQRSAPMSAPMRVHGNDAPNSGCCPHTTGESAAAARTQFCLTLSHPRQFQLPDLNSIKVETSAVPVETALRRGSPNGLPRLPLARRRETIRICSPSQPVHPPLPEEPRQPPPQSQQAQLLRPIQLFAGQWRADESPVLARLRPLTSTPFRAVYPQRFSSRQRRSIASVPSAASTAST